jgi:hypothetical protein
VSSVSVRLRRRIGRDFPESGSAREIESLVGEGGDNERVQAAIVLWGSRGSRSHSGRADACVAGLA